MRAKLAVILGILFIIIIITAVGWYMYNKPHEGVADVSTDFQIAAADLYDDFQKDENAANKKYLNKKLSIRCPINFSSLCTDRMMVVVGNAVSSTRWGRRIRRAIGARIVSNRKYPA